MAWPVRDVLTKQQDLSRGRRQDAGNDVEQGRFASPVRPDDSLSISWKNLQVDVAHRVEAAKALAQPLQRENRLSAILSGLPIHPKNSLLEGRRPYAAA